MWTFFLVCTSNILFNNSATYSCMVVLFILATGTFILIVWYPYIYIYHNIHTSWNTHFSGLLAIGYLPCCACWQVHDHLSEFFELRSMQWYFNTVSNQFVIWTIPNRQLSFLLHITNKKYLKLIWCERFPAPLRHLILTIITRVVLV